MQESKTNLSTTTGQPQNECGKGIITGANEGNEGEGMVGRDTQVLPHGH